MKIKKEKKKSFGWFSTLNPDVGDVEKGIEVFNHISSPNASECPATGDSGGMGESLNEESELTEATELEEKQKIFQQIKSINPNAKYENYEKKSINAMIGILNNYRKKAGKKPIKKTKVVNSNNKKNNRRIYYNKKKDEFKIQGVKIGFETEKAAEEYLDSLNEGIMIKMTREQLVKGLNWLDKQCLEEGYEFKDLKTLFEATEKKLNAQEVNEITRLMKAGLRDVDEIETVMQAKLMEEDFNEEEDAEWERIATKSVMDYDGFYTDYTLWYNNMDNYWETIFGDNELYNPVNQYADAEFETEEEAWEWFESYNGFEDEYLDESYEDGEYDYFAVYKDDKLVGEYPTYEDAKKDACDGCVIKGVTQYGGDMYEETPLNEDYNHPMKDFRDWCEEQYWPGFNPDDLSDEEYYELEDAYRKSVNEN